MSAKRKFPQKLGQPMVKPSAKPATKNTVEEIKTMVSGGGKANRPLTNGTNGSTIEISSDSSGGEEADSNEESAEDDEEEEEAEADTTMNDAEPVSKALILQSEEGEEQEEEDAAPSFGELVLATTSSPIDVAGAFEEPQSLLSRPHMQLSIPTGASLGTVLSQALKTNDLSLLESCLNTTDLPTVRSTIQRLSSPLAGTLLYKLAERLHRRPGRAGSLMVWVQWTLITHGGYIAGQPELVRKLAELNKVVEERARGLQSLLLLKGKLDMLESQMELRRSMQTQRRIDEDSDNEEDVIYVEGQDEEVSDEDSGPKPQKLATNGDLEDISDAESDDMPTTTNGAIADSEEDDDESSEEDLIDDEAEESDAETGDEDDVDHEDHDSEDGDEDSDEGVAPPRKVLKSSGAFSRRK